MLLSLLPCRFPLFPFQSRLIYRSLGVACEPSQECLPRFREPPNGATRLLPGSSVFLCPVTWCLSRMVLRGHLSLSDVTVGTVGHLCAVSRTESSRGKRDPFCQPVTLSTPFCGRQAVRVLVPPGSLSQTHPLDTFSETGAFSHCKRPSPNTNWGTPKWPLNGTLAFAKSREGLGISLRSVLHGPQSESGFEGLMPHGSSCCLPVSCPPLFLSVRFPR